MILRYSAYIWGVIGVGWVYIGWVFTDPSAVMIGIACLLATLGAIIYGD